MENSQQDSRDNEAGVSPSGSFEALEPHDPVISRLATQLFHRTNEYLQGEMAAGQEHYALLEEINRQSITKFTDLRNFVSNLAKTVEEHEQLCERRVRPLLGAVEGLEARVLQAERRAYRLDAATRRLLALYRANVDR